MTIVSSEVRINASKERVWEIMANLGGVVNYNPNIINSYYTSDQKEGIGASRICDIDQKTSIEETAIEWQDGESYTLKVVFLKGLKPPVSDFTATISLKEDGDGTFAKIVGQYQPKFGLLGKLMDRFMLKPQYEKLMPSVVEGLKHHVETDELVDKEVYKRIRAVAKAA